MDQLRKKVMKEGKNQIEIQVSRLTSDLIKSLKKIQGVEVVEESGNSLNITCAEDLRLEISKAIVENGVFPLLMKTRDYTLEEIYVTYFAER